MEIRTFPKWKLVLASVNHKGITIDMEIKTRDVTGRGERGREREREAKTRLNNKIACGGSSSRRTHNFSGCCRQRKKSSSF